MEPNTWGGHAEEKKTGEKKKERESEDEGDIVLLLEFATYNGKTRKTEKRRR